MGAVFVVAAPPRLDDHRGFSPVRQQLQVQALIPQLAVEAIYVAGRDTDIFEMADFKMRASP